MVESCRFLGLMFAFVWLRWSWAWYFRGEKFLTLKGLSRWHLFLGTVCAVLSVTVLWFRTAALSNDTCILFLIGGAFLPFVTFLLLFPVWLARGVLLDGVSAEEGGRFLAGVFLVVEHVAVFVPCLMGT